jgi:hypothetical protein
MSAPNIYIRGEWAISRFWWLFARISLRVFLFAMNRTFYLKIESDKWKQIPVSISVDITNA